MPPVVQPAPENALPTVFDICQPRDDIEHGRSVESDFAADLAQVIRGEGPADYREPARFFARTYPTRGLKELLRNVCSRLTGAGEGVASLFRLDTSYGGGKTHALIALVHAAGGMQGVANPEEFLPARLVPAQPIRVAAFDGENADPANGRRMGDGIIAYTPWGELAAVLGGRAGYERLRNSDEQRVAPGAETLRELFGDRPALILLDELSVYLRKLSGLAHGRDQLTAFLTSLFKAVESAPEVALVYTLAIGRDGVANDAYAEENQFIAARMAEAEAVSARKATLLNPTEDDETAQVLRRRLFASIDDAQAATVVDAYRARWTAHRDALPGLVADPETAEDFRRSYPFHPDLLDTLTDKTSTLANFQRVRGMLRLLARTVGRVWQQRPAGTLALHLNHIDLGFEPIRQEFVTKLQLSGFTPAIHSDIAAGEKGKLALAQAMDATNYRGLPPYGTWVARCIFVHSMAFNDRLKGVTPEHLRYSILSPSADLSFIEDARKRFIEGSAYLDDRPTAPMRFLTEANLTQMLRRFEQQVDPGDARTLLADRIRKTFQGGEFAAVPFPAIPSDLSDEIGNGRPLLAVLSYEAASVGATVEAPPELAVRLYERKGSEGAGLRSLKNNVVFVAAEEARREPMRVQAVRLLALQMMNTPDRLRELADHQKQQVQLWAGKSEQVLNTAIQQCYRHLFYPSRRSLLANVTLAHVAVEVSQHDNPGMAQRGIVNTLRECGKLRLREDQPDSPAYLREKTPLKRGQMTMEALRDEFRREPELPILIEDATLQHAVRNGVEQGDFVYQRGDLLYGPGDPLALVLIEAQAFVSTMAYAREHGIWPRPQPAPATPPEEGPAPGGPTPPVAPPNGPDRGPAPTPAGEAFATEGVLREALVELWERLRSRRVARIGSLSITPLDYADGMRMVSSISSMPNAEKRVRLDAECEAKDGSELQVHFNGSLNEVMALKDFLAPQLQDAAERNAGIEFTLGFPEGMDLAAQGPEKIAERLGAYASGSAFIKATAVPR